ncbi:MAG: DUF2975 domain-containing protein [Clostridiales Family XIII bacterium]|nr:DUF2975 domain-containing protein [Clostridiales Family XIII bacterium]
MKSVQLSFVCTRIVIALTVLSAVWTATPLGRHRLTASLGYAERAGAENAQTPLIMGLYYACCIPALVALLCLDRLLGNIKKERVFVEENVKALRTISWCCFAEALLFAAAALYYAHILLVPAIAMAFFGLILRVVKNVIDAAVSLKTENDFTI